MRAMIRQIRIDQSRGLTLSQTQWMQIQGEWLRVFGGPGLSYPDVTIMDMVKDLEDHLKGD